MYSGPVFLALRILLTASLYLFLGWAFYSLWLDLRRQSSLLQTSQTPSLMLNFQLDGLEHTLRFDGPEVIVGRDPASDLCLEDNTISAQHTRLAYHHGQWWVEDLHSTNGTFLNQEPLSEPLVITSGDQIRMGQVLLQIQVENKKQPVHPGEGFS